MREWNVLVTVRDRLFREAIRLLEPLGEVKRTGFYNVLTMQVEDLSRFLETIREWMERYPDTAESVGRVAVFADCFEFHSADEFAAQARVVGSRYLPQLSGRGFHVRVHRHGNHNKLNPTHAERDLGQYLLQQLEQQSDLARAEFRDPDAVVVIETLNDRAGVKLWTRDELRRYPFVKVD